ncbi:MAG TPA: hypothetical protein VIW29_20190 [Polyangiaceae bacterium]
MNEFSMPRRRTFAAGALGVALTSMIASPAGAQHGAAPAAEPKQAPSWYDRAPLTVGTGEGRQRWALTFYGFVEADVIVDSTRSYGDAIGTSLVARSDTYPGNVGRTQFTMRNTRLGLKLESPLIAGFLPSALLEGDFYGPPAEHASESATYSSPTFRVRQAYLSLESAYVSVLAGQTYDVFGWQNHFFPCSAEFLGLPNQVFSRNTQFRLSHTFGVNGPVSVDVAAAAVRPAQRDSGIPDAHAGVRLGLPRLQGISTPGSSGTRAVPLSLGISGVFRRFRVNAFTPPPAQTSNTANGWGVSIDALIPVIPARDANDRGNRLTLTGSFVTGSGIGDLLTATGGADFPTLPNPAQANPPPEYEANVDPGLVSFDTQGVLHTIDWQAFRAGLEYHLPPSGRVTVAANYSQAFSKNMDKLFPQGGAEIELLGRVADTSRYADVNVFWDATPAARFGLSGQYTEVAYLDGDQPHNLRGMALALYAF